MSTLQSPSHTPSPCPSLDLGLTGSLGDVRVIAGALVPWPHDERAGLRELVSSGLPEGARVELGEPRVGASDLGWPFLRFEAQALDADGRTIEERLCLVYRFFEHAGVAIAVVPPGTLGARRDELRDALGHGRPDWGRGVVAELEVWDGLSGETEES